MKITVFTIIISLFHLHSLIAQVFESDYNRIAADDVEWSEGAISLTDGKNLQGLLKYNSKTGVLAFESGSISKSFTARTVINFTFFDVHLNKNRSFISVDYQNLDINGNFDTPTPLKHKKPTVFHYDKDRAAKLQGTHQFFEVLFEMPTFALLSVSSKVQAKTSSAAYAGAVTTYSQTEALFIFDKNGDIKKWVEITNKESDSFLIDTKTTSRKTIERDLLKDYTDPHYEKLKEYAKQNKLSFKKRDDILKILEYYKELIEK
jgi:hypothetical protein